MNYIPVPLNIDEIKILKIEQDSNDDIIVTVESAYKKTNCKACGKKITKVHDYGKYIYIRHLPLFDNPVYLKIKPVRYKCESCDNSPTTTESFIWCNVTTRTTKQYDKYILRSLISSTILDVTKKENINYDIVKSILDSNISISINWDDYSGINLLGLDEISLKKGHKDFVVIVSTKINGKIGVIAILKDRKKETVKEFLSTIPENIRTKIKFVCTDMYDGFVNAVTEIFDSKVVVVIDRFHVAKLYRTVLDNTRKKELQRLKQDLSKDEYSKFQGAMWALRKNPDEATDEEKTILKHLFKYSPLLLMIYNLTNELTTIFNSALQFREANKKINKWIAKIKKTKNHYFDKFLKTFKKYKHNILNYFKKRQTSGFVEGLNNKIKVIKRRCYGIFVIENLFRRIKLDLTGYSKYI